jgi:phosphoribosylglycinamide formyltransferase-1
MLNIGILVSGGGTNLQAVIDRITDGTLKECRIATVISSKPGAYALERARINNIPSTCISRKQFSSIDEYDEALIKHLDSYNIELVLLAGFLSILEEQFIVHYNNRIINVHPSLIPSFCGKGFYGHHVHEAAIAYGVKVSGCTIHFANEEYDAGPIVIQQCVPVRQDDTPDTLAARILPEEHRAYLQAIQWFAEGRLSVVGRKVIVSGAE